MCSRLRHRHPVEGCPDDPKETCTQATYTIAINVNEKFVKLQLSQQTLRVRPQVKWFADILAQIVKEHPERTVHLAVSAAFNKRTIGWQNGAEWEWEEEYAAAITRRALR